MPLYPFACSECGQTFEVFVPRVSTDASEPCPACGSTRVERAFGLPARPAVKGEGDFEPTCLPDGPPCGAPWCGRNPIAGRALD